MERLAIKKFTLPLIVFIVAWGCNHYSSATPGIAVKKEKAAMFGITAGQPGILAKKNIGKENPRKIRSAK